MYMFISPPTVALSANSTDHLCREEFNHNIPTANRHSKPHDEEVASAHGLWFNKEEDIEPAHGSRILKEEDIVPTYPWE